VTDVTPPPGAETPPPAPPAPARRLWILIAGGVVLLATGVWVVFAALPGYLTTPDDAVAVPAAGAAPVEDTRTIQATLYYVSDDGLELVPVSREVRYGATPAEQARHIAEAQVAAPSDGQASAIPAGTTVRAVYLGARGDAYVDLSPEASTAHQGGSLNEALAVYALVNALTANLPDVTAVQILVDGREVDTLAGHLDLRQPFRRALKWVRKAQQLP
jgi:hypothetical protein